MPIGELLLAAVGIGMLMFVRSRGRGRGESGMRVCIGVAKWWVQLDVSIAEVVW